ncbi:MAG TPA: hypothetical protein VK815_06070, partial [Candidatus Acidoferrales bacterium]|nr:hypothetical protein [Candidatus Acidoferrales bacterium]
SLFSWNSKAKDLDSAARANFEWFGTLGFPDVKGCPCVRLENGGYWAVDGKPENINYIEAFVLATNAGNLTLFGTDLYTRTVTNANQPKGRIFGDHFDRINLRDGAQAKIATLQNRPAKEDSLQHFNRASEERAEVFVLAWACWRQGLLEESQQLYEQVGEMRTRIHGHDHFSNFREALEMDFGHAMMWRAVLDLRDPSVSRQDALKEFQEIPEKYPHSEYCGQARQMARVLTRMINEEQTHVRIGTNDLASLPVEARIQELVYRLRDQNGHQIIFPGRCDVFDVFDGVSYTTNTPAHQLVRLGYAAVPALIAAVDSDTLSRSLAERRFSDAPDVVLTVGDCAEQVLEKITGRSFYTPKDGNSYMSEAGEGEATRQAAGAWWAEFQQKGEKQTLMDAVTAAGHDAPAQAELLCQRYPDVATATLIRGANAATNNSVRAELVQQIGKIAEPSGIEFLEAELLHGPYLRSRVAAAFNLRQRGDQNATTAMIREWARQPPKDAADKYEWKEVIEFLSGSDSADAVSALGTNLLQRPAQIKLEVISEVGETNRMFNRDEKTYPSPATLAAIEQVLAGSLEDTEECYNTYFGRNEKNLADPRICDVAAWFLADRWPARYAFDVSGSLGARNRQRMECLNFWRTAHNLPPLAMAGPEIQPPQPTVGRSEAAKVTMIEWSEDSAKPGPEFAARISSLKDKRLDPEKVVGLLTHFAGYPEKNSMGLKLEVSKDTDLKGVSIIVRLIPGTPPTPTGSIGWDVSEHVVLGGKTIGGSSGGGIMEAYAEPKSWEDLESAMEQAVSAPAETPFEMSVRIVAGGGTRITPPTR